MSFDVLITGDVILDHHIYEGQQRRPNSLMRLGTRHTETRGGAHLLYDLLATYAQQFPQAQQTWQQVRIEQAERARLYEAERKNKPVQPLLPEEREATLQGMQFVELRPTLGLKTTDLKPYPHLQGCGLYAPYPAEPMLRESAAKPATIWRLKQALGYGARPASRRENEAFIPEADAKALGRPYHLWVIDDAGADFRDWRSTDAWPLVLRGASGPELPEWIVLKMSAPLAFGDLWQTLTQGQFRDKALTCGPLAERMVVVVSADDLRCESALVSQGVSWERTALDLAAAVRETPALRQLAACRHLIVMFGAEGAALIDGRNQQDPRVHLVFDPANQEGDWAGRIEGDVFGKLSCFVAGIVSRLPASRALGAQAAEGSHDPAEDEVNCLIHGVSAGLSAVRRLLLCGHISETAGPRLPLAEVAAEILRDFPDASEVKPPQQPSFRFEHVMIPKNVASGLMETRSPATASAGGANAISVWRILEGNPAQKNGRAGLTLGQARLVAQFGLQKLSGVPYLTLGALKTVDRGEIENLRSIKRLIEDYRNNPQAKRPLSLGVFGQPGSGKSFGIKQLAAAVLHDAPLEFNLSQLSAEDNSVLIGALHQVRDKVLEGKMPVVFWDEFDARQLHWLAKLLAPMQDGTFLEGQMVHPVGKCIFVFAGGTSYDFASFGPPELTAERLAKLDDEQRGRLQKEQEQFRAQKGPDFKGRLTAYLNVAGPNQRKIRDWAGGRYEPDASDTGYSMRRALLLRSQLRLKDDKPLEIDSGLLTALLEIDEYRHGARSMEKMVEQMVARSGGRRLMPSHVPPDEILDLHVDADEFRKLLARDLEFQRMAEVIAPYIHISYCEHVTETGGEFHDRVRKEYQMLDPDLKDINIAAARRMPEVLATVGLLLVKNSADGQATSDDVRAHIDEHADVMAEAEHTLWWEYLLKNNWTSNPVRHDSAKQHDCLMPFAVLPKHQQDKDRQQVKEYPKFAADVGFHIEFRNKPV